MPKQTVVSFVYGLSRDGIHCSTRIEDQINEFIRQHPDHKVKSIGTIVTSLYQEALVVFDILNEENDLSKLLRNEEIRGEREPVKKEYRPNGQDRSSRKT